MQEQEQEQELGRERGRAGAALFAAARRAGSRWRRERRVCGARHFPTPGGNEKKILIQKKNLTKDPPKKNLLGVKAHERELVDNVKVEVVGGRRKGDALERQLLGVGDVTQLRVPHVAAHVGGGETFGRIGGQQTPDKVPGLCFREKKATDAREDSK